MNKRNLIICAAKYVHVDGGYLSRIQSELESICLDFNVYMFIPKGSASEETFKNKVKVIQYPYVDKNDIATYINNVKSCKSHFKRMVKEIKDPVIYCEALVGSMWILNTARKAHLQIVFDCHGTEADEILMRPHTVKRMAYAAVLRYFEKIAVKSSELIVTVSNKQYEKWMVNKNHVKFPMIPSDIFFQTTCFRDDARMELNIPHNATVFVYCGGTAIWQMCEETIGLYKKIEETIPDSFLLVLTGSPNLFVQLIDKYSIRNHSILTAKYIDVPKYLDAADFGFCIRINNIVNNVASPTKILEYLARNVKPIITACIGDFSEELRSLDLACIMDDSLDNIEDIKKSDGFDGISYVKQIRCDYIKNYVNALKKL